MGVIPELVLARTSVVAGGEPALRVAAGALALRAVDQVRGSTPGAAFTRARAWVEVASLSASAERAVLERLLLVIAEPDAATQGLLLIAELLVRYAGELETARRLPEADLALAMAREAAPADAEIALHAGRVARQLGERERALDLYRAARELDGAEGVIGRLAAIGEAVVAEDAEAALGRAIRRSMRFGDHEAAAVGLEERARLRRLAGRRRAAVRDLCVAALRFRDPVDRSRVAHRIADITVAAADPLAAREALLVALTSGDGPQRDHARSRLHTICRGLGDQVGMRCWRSFERPALVSLAAPRRVTPHSAAPLLARWRERMEQS